ncbi:Transmembrane protein 63C [Mortierella sp. GBA39]|nr:Transmembrane protein 63C [Mortierella sp. GBA39]
MGGGEGQGSGNNNSSRPFNSHKVPGIWSRLMGLLVAGKASAVSIIESNNTSASTTVAMRETNKEVEATNEESSAIVSSTLKPPQQQARSTVSVNSTTSSQQHIQQPTTSQPALNGSSTSTSSPSSEKASTLARQEIIAKIGLDHYLLIRFLKMLFAISVILGLVAISLVPLYMIRQTGEDLQGSDDLLGAGSHPTRRVEILQIGNVTDNERLWAAVLAVALVSGLILVWSWSELMLFLKLRQEFLIRSASRYSSRVVLLQDLPKDFRTVESLKQLFAAAPGGGVEHVYLVRDVSRLEKAVKQRQVVLDKLEETESKYMSAIARASAMVSFTTLNMRSRSWLGRCVDRVKTCFGLEGSSVGGNGGQSPGEEDYVGHLKLYQLSDVPKLSLADLSSSTVTNSVSNASERRSSQTLQQQGTTLSNVSSSGGLAVLKWYQKPRRPRHYAGIPLLSKRQDSIRYYRGELCRLNKVIEQEYLQQAKAMADDRQGIRQPHTHRPQGRAGKGLHPDARSTPSQAGFVNGHESVVILDDVATASETEKGASPMKSARPNQVETLPAAFILMKTRAGAKAIAFGTIGQDQIPVKSRTLGIPPRDIEWRALGQATSCLSKLLRRTMIISVGSLLVVGCGLVVSAIALMAVFKGWERVIEEEAEVLAGPAVYLRQGVLAPLLLGLLMFAGSWILNELCQYWGRVSKIQTDLLTQRCYFYFLLVNMIVVHPVVSLSLSWQESAFTEVDSLSNFLIHAIPSYCSFAFSYILTAGLMLPLHHILQFSRLWATLPAVTLWSALGPLSWRKSNRLHKSKSHRDHTGTSSVTADAAGKGSAVASTCSTESSTSSNSASLEDNFSPAPTQTPRQAFQTRQPPFFNLQNLYPHLVLMFTISLALLPLAPLLFLFWIVVLMTMNLCYRYLVLQVVTAKSQSGGLHYLQAIKFVLFPTLACPPLLLVVYLGIRQAWIQAGFSAVLLAAVLVARVVVGVQFGKREEMMLEKVEAYHLQPEVLLLHSGKASGAGGKSGGKARAVRGGGQDAVVHLGHLSPSSLGHEAGSIASDARGFSSDSDGEGLSPSNLDEHGKETTSPRRRMIKRMIQRPTTIIGHYRNSFVSTISGSSRPKSVPVFDLERYEKEILGIAYVLDAEPAGSQQGSSIQAVAASDQDPTHSRQSSLVRAQTVGHASAHVRTASSSTGFEPTFSFADGTEDSEIHDLFPSYSSMGHGAGVAGSVLSKAEEEEVKKEVKYREIVKALRRASTVASRKQLDAPFVTSNNNAASGAGSQQRRVRMAGAPGFASSSLESVNETKTTGQFNRRANGTNNKSLFRASLPALLNPRPLHYANNPYLLHQRGIDDALSSVSMSSRVSNSGRHTGRGAPPSLPMLLIHRESVVAAKEWSRIQELYLNPVLQEAKKKVIVWLPSQTEQSFWGASPSSWSGIHGHGNSQHHHRQQPAESFSARTLSSFGHCKRHAALQVRDANEANDLAISEAPGASGGPSTLTSDIGDTATDGSHSVTAPVQDRSTFGLSTSTLAQTQNASDNRHCRQQQQQHHECTCLIYQEVLKAVADAVALADQEIRDLRIVGLTVWLDSRHVIWGQDKEEDGQLGDRVMISTSPSMEFGGPQQRQVGDGLLSWLEVDENVEGVEGFEGGVGGIAGGREMQCRAGKGVAGIIGGSMGVIMRRPVGRYGRLVGDGEEDDISHGLHSV